MGRLNFDTARASWAQIILSSKVITFDDFNRPIKYVAGIDVGYLKDVGIGSAVVLDYDTLRVVDKKHVIREVSVPYIPTFLAFREIPLMALVYKKLSVVPDVTLVDAHGIMHPRRFGAASHLGVVLNIPTVGVAKSKLFGEVCEDGYVYDGDEVIGRKVGKVYVSVGHRVSLNSAVEIVRRVTKNSMPVPTKLAHQYVGEVKKRLLYRLFT